MPHKNHKLNCLKQSYSALSELARTIEVYVKLREDKQHCERQTQHSYIQQDSKRFLTELISTASKT